MFSTQEQARQRLVRTRQQQQNRRANLLGRSASELLPRQASQS